MKPGASATQRCTDSGVESVNAALKALLVSDFLQSCSCARETYEKSVWMLVSKIDFNHGLRGLCSH